jgi:two-component system copper resistance phosphate regulon response regulator CusR
MRLLLVEDVLVAGRLLAKGLRDNAYAVDVVTDGDTAIARVGVNDYDLIILDLGLPDIDGIALCEALRKQAVHAPVLMLTARDAVQMRVAGLDSGADDYMTKPFDLDELLARLRALLRRGARTPLPEHLVVGPLRLDTRAQTAHCADVRLPLTTREYAFLEYLARHAGEVVGRSAIAEHVWDDSYDPMSNVIEVYVQRLRRKLTLGGGDSLIKTRRGAGYVLSEDSPANG